jgi:ribosomal-protein-alanine N-acetyltransferase
MLRKVFLEPLRPEHEAELLAAVERSRTLHAAWVQPPSSHEAFADYIAARSSLRTAVRTEAGDLAAVINVNEIVLGTFRSAYLGFYALVPHEGHGYVRAGLLRIIDAAFAGEGLHRLEANVQPTNERSLRLVRSLGLREEGFSPRYLNIAGAWRDHVRFAITVEEWPGRARDG